MLLIPPDRDHGGDGGLDSEDGCGASAHDGGYEYAARPAGRPGRGGADDGRHARGCVRDPSPRASGRARAAPTDVATRQGPSTRPPRSAVP